MSKQKTLAEKLESYFIKNPNATNEQASEKFNTTRGTVKTIKHKLRKKGTLEKFDKIMARNPENRKIAAAIEGDRRSSDEEIKSKIIALFKKKGVKTFEELSDHFDKGVGKIKQLILELKDQGYNYLIEDNSVITSTEVAKSEDVYLDINKMSTGFYRFGAIGDNHLCSKYERLDILNAIYDHYEKEKINIVFNTGNWIDGEARFNSTDLLVHGLDDQIAYFIKNYPKRPGIITKFISGDDHEGWYVKDLSIDIGRYAELKAREAGRTDLEFIGHMEADIILKAKQGQTKIRVLHPGGGSAYATSYTTQKIVESYTSGEKPDILLIGHYHKAEYLFYRGVHAIQTACTEDQTPFMRKKRLAAHLGGWIFEFSTDEKGAIRRFKQEFFPFYNTEYYNYKWSYKH